MRREIDRFTCKSEDGETFIVVVTQDILTFRDQATGKVEEVPGGMRRFKLSDGSDITRVDNKPDAFKIIQSGQIITRSDIA